MIVSMTGFGKSEIAVAGKLITIEVRCLNSKNLDMSVKLPALFRHRESAVRSLLSGKLYRGKVELLLTIDSGSDSAAYTINTELLINYFRQIKQTAGKMEVDVSDDFLPDLLRLPDVLKPKTEAVDDKEWIQIEKGIADAVDQVVQFRRSEGRHLEKDIADREKIIRKLLRDIEPYENDRVTQIRDRILRSLNNLGDDIHADANRFEQEVIFYLEKLDITEEKVRLHKHLDYLLETMHENDCGGKKMGFITQEIGREINTIGSKANNAEIQKIVVQMKDELEKIKEQLMNVL